MIILDDVGINYDSGEEARSLSNSCTNSSSPYSAFMAIPEQCPGKIQGKNYYFLTCEKFESLIQKGDMLEHTEYCHNYYGTPRTVVEEQLAIGHDVILEIEVEGAMQVKKAFPGAVMIFIMPPSRTELERLLRNRGTETDDVVRERLVIAAKEMSRLPKYDYTVVNAEARQAADDILSILSEEKLKAQRIN